MQAAGRSCSRVLRAFSQAAAASSENSRVITQHHASSSSCSSIATLLAPLPSLQTCLQSPGHSFTTSAAASQKQIDAATREDWPSLTREQKKQALKPEKNRNHFKRMWKKDLQIKHAHQARKRQQAAADAQRQKSLQEKWRAGASMWQSTSKTSDVTESH